MNRMLRRSVAITWLACWSLGLFASPAHALPANVGTGTVSGRLLSATKSSAGYEVLLLDESWDLVARTPAGATGAYEFEGVQPGRYRMGIADGQGRLAPVVGPLTEVAAGASAIVSISVGEAGKGVQLAPGAYGPSANSWWDRQTRNQKIFWTAAAVVGTGLVTWGVLELLDDDDEETPASPSSN